MEPGLSSTGGKRLATGQIFAALVVAAIFWYNLTPFTSVDCWWHMRWAEYFLTHGSPVLYDPFAVQTGEKILATYPNAFSGSLFLKLYDAQSLLPLNLLRIVVYWGFFTTLVLAVKRAWSGYSILLQIIVLAFSMAGSAVLRPDLFNYVIFTLWVYHLERIIMHPRKYRYFLGLLFLEALWVNTHPLFVYHGLFFGVVYLLSSAFLSFSDSRSSQNDDCDRRKPVCIYALIMAFFWLLNPLGWRAVESLFINMLDPALDPGSCRFFSDSLLIVNTYGFFLIVALFLFQKPWSWEISLSEKLRYAVAFVILALPALIYERCLPFPCIFLILLQGMRHPSPKEKGAFSKVIFMALVVLGALFLIADRHTLISKQMIHQANTVLKTEFRSYDAPAGIGLLHVESTEPIREVTLLNQVAVAGNSISNDLALSSCAVWFCPDKPFFVHGHAAVLNARIKEWKNFLSNLATEEAKRFMERLDIRTVVLKSSNEMVMANCENLSKNLTLLYMDPSMAVFARNGSITHEQEQKIRRFYSIFMPGFLDTQSVNPSEQVLQLVLLWFSCEVTGNDGSLYLSRVRKLLPPEKVIHFQEKLRPIIEKTKWH